MKVIIRVNVKILSTNRNSLAALWAYDIKPHPVWSIVKLLIIASSIKTSVLLDYKNHRANLMILIDFRRAEILMSSCPTMGRSRTFKEYVFIKFQWKHWRIESWVQSCCHLPCSLLLRWRPRRAGISLFSFPETPGQEPGDLIYVCWPEVRIFVQFLRRMSAYCYSDVGCQK